MYLVPPVAGLVAWWFLGERCTVIKLVGAALARAGVALAQFASPPREPGRSLVREAAAPVD
jgi:drug/metabolite transporter (DMT)-like permease